MPRVPAPTCQQLRRDTCPHTRLALQLLLLSASASAAWGLGPTVPFWMTYDESFYLKGWAQETFANWPMQWWIQSRACPGSTPGLYPGVLCANVSGQLQVAEIDLSAANLPKGSVPLEGELKDPPFVLGLNFLASLTLDNAGLKGSVPGSLTLASKLSQLVLSNNNLTGNLPPQLCSLNLSCLSFANNSLEGPIPSCWAKFPCADFAGNYFINFGTGCNTSLTLPSCAPPAPPPSGDGSSGLDSASLAAIIVASVVALLAVLAGLGVYLMVGRERRRKQDQQADLLDRLEEDVQAGAFGDLQRYTQDELAEACDEFSDDNLVGQGPRASVYKGFLEDGSVVAVKKYKMAEAARLDRELAFAEEVEAMSHVAHRNVVHALGFCLDVGEGMALVTRFYPNGSVASRTRGKQGSPLSWLARRNIARGAAEGLTYLHRQCEPAIIHRNFKAENVLLDEKEAAIVSDYGAPQETPLPGPKRALSNVAPEVFPTEEYGERTDVYAFGVFLVELVSGVSLYELARETHAPESGVHEWLGELLGENELASILDPELGQAGDEVAEDALKVLEVAQECLRDDPDERPSMDEVARMLGEGSEGLAAHWADKIPEESSVGNSEELLKVLKDPSSWDKVSTGVVLPPLDLDRARTWLSQKADDESPPSHAR